MNRGPAPSLDELLAAVVRGMPVDWAGGKVPGAQISAALRSAMASGQAASAVSIVNAEIIGDLTFDAVGDEGRPTRLQILNCRIAGGFRSRGSRWRNLMIARSSLEFVDLSRSAVEGDIILEVVECRTWLALDGCRVGGMLSLHESRFDDGDRMEAINLSSTEIGGEIDARDLWTSGEFKAQRVTVGADLRLDGANLDDSHSEPATALDLHGAQIGGQARLCQGTERFQAAGTIVFASAKLGSLTMKAARIDGRGRPALVGDQLVVKETLDLSGLSNDDGSQFEASGAVRLGSSVVGRQVQIYDAAISAPEPALILHGASIGGDLMIGYEGCTTAILGGIAADLCKVEGIVRCAMLELRGPQSALSLRQARIAQQIALYDLVADGPVKLDNIEAAAISVQGLRCTRSAPVQRSEDVPESYAHADDALLDLTFANIRSDLRLEQVTIEGGDIRMNGTRVGSAIQVGMISVRPDAKLALLGQALEVGSGFIIEGSAERPASFAGEVRLVGARIGGDLTLVRVNVGTADAPADLILTTISADQVTFVHSEIHGSLNGANCRVQGDVQLNSSRFLNPGKVAIDLRRVRVGGKLQLAAATYAEPVSCEVHGLVTADAANVGSLAWYHLKLKANSRLEFTNIAVERQLEAGRLDAEEPSRIDLGGTATPLLADIIDDAEDGWGAGRAGLGLDNFSYARLKTPSGKDGDDPPTIRRWRRVWLARRYDPRSPRPGRQLARVLKDQGLFEASRLTLIDAFAAEGRLRPTPIGRSWSWLFGALFGHGLSGRAAAATLVALWLAGALGLSYLDDRGLLVANASTEARQVQCPKAFDPLLTSADLMIPIVDLGYEKTCVVGSGDGVPGLGAGRSIRGWRLFGELAFYRAALVVFQIAGWIVLSLAIATWSGLFKRGGRD